MRRRSGSSCAAGRRRARRSAARSRVRRPPSRRRRRRARAAAASEQERAAAWARVRGGGGARGGGSAAGAAAQSVGVRRVARCVERRRKEWTAELLKATPTPRTAAFGWKCPILRASSTRYTRRGDFPTAGAAARCAASGRAPAPPAAHARRAGGNPCVRIVLREAAEAYIVVSQRDDESAPPRWPPPPAAADGAGAGAFLGFVVLSAADVDAVRVRAARRGRHRSARHALPLSVRWRATERYGWSRGVRACAVRSRRASGLRGRSLRSAPAAIELELLPSFDGFTASGLARLARRWAARRRRRSRRRTVARSCGGRRPARSTTTTCAPVGHASPPSSSRYRAEDDAAARRGARRCVPPPAGRRVARGPGATGGPPPIGPPPRLGARPLWVPRRSCSRSLPKRQRPRRWRPRRRPRRGGGGFVQRSYDQRSRNARADDILEAVMQRSRRR